QTNARHFRWSSKTVKIVEALRHSIRDGRARAPNATQPLQGCLAITAYPMNLTRFLFRASSPSVSTASLRLLQQFQPVSCCDRNLGQGQFPPKRLARQTFFRARGRFAKSVHRPDSEAKCFATTPEDRP